MGSAGRNLLLATGLTLPLGAAEGGWALELRTEPSRVELEGNRTTWWTNQLQALYRDPAKGGLFLSAETQQRGAETNPLLSAGTYLRRGDWTYWVQGAAGIDPTFVVEYAWEAQVSRRLFATFHLAAAYQHLEFPTARVKLASLAGIYYFAAGEAELRIREGRNETFDHLIQARLLRILLDRGGRWAVGTTLVVGNNLFDTLLIPVDGGRGWTANLNLRWRIDGANSLRFDAGVGRESPDFRQQLVSVAYRRSF